MSGYLQRMTGAARKPQSRVHPLMRPLFENDSSGDGAQAPIGEVVTERGRASFGLRGVDPNPERQPHTLPADPETGLARPEESSVLEERQTSSVAGSQPAVTRSAGRLQALLPSSAEPTVPVTRSTGDGVSVPHEAEIDRVAVGGVSGAVGQVGGAAASRSPFRALLPPLNEAVEGATVTSAQSRDPSLDANRRMREEAAGASRLRSAAEMASARRQAQQQAPVRPEPRADEIQIHIGRIEVTAMPAPASRPLPAPRRKSQTLGEYLEQRKGRPG